MSDDLQEDIAYLRGRNQAAWDEIHRLTAALDRVRAIVDKGISDDEVGYRNAAAYALADLRESLDGPSE